jgi:type II secretory pathway component GspD/PulD (secretin)
VPGAREIPGLGFLFGQKQKTSLRRRLLIYITPYLWDPGLETPVDSRSGLETFMRNQDGFETGPGH